MLVYAVDIGTTNLKVALYDEFLRNIAIASVPAEYERHGKTVEFDPAGLFDVVIELINRCAAEYDVSHHDAVIALTGQAESLVLIGRDDQPIRPAISWLDDRAMDEAQELGQRFEADTAFSITGQPFPSTTWPAAKLRWLSKHDPRALTATAAVLMVKDDVIRRLTGQALGEVTTRGFSYLWNVPRGEYWGEMLDFCAVSIDVLPEVVAAGTDVGPVTAEVADRLPAAAGYRVNVGALDHFCAMVGTGSYRPEVVSESAGTVLSLSMLAPEWRFDSRHKVSFHPGLEPNETVLFNGVDSGGVALDWFRREGLDDMAYADLERALVAGADRMPPMFLPYLTGVNPPDYFPDARGAFLELGLSHSRIDLAHAVEEGIAHLLRRNVEYLSAVPVNEIISTGGGTASAFFNQLKADVCGIDVLVPEEKEATCRGAAALALIAAGRLDGVDDVRSLHQPRTVRYRPAHSSARAERYRRFDDYLHRLYEPRLEGQR